MHYAYEIHKYGGSRTFCQTGLLLNMIAASIRIFKRVQHRKDDAIIFLFFKDIARCLEGHTHRFMIRMIRFCISNPKRLRNSDFSA